jgi:hypothetical protein
VCVGVKIGSEIIFELDYAYLYNTYKDLWLTETARKKLAFSGIQDDNSRKTRADLKSTIATTLHNQMLKNMYGKRYIIPINFEMITDHMPIFP